jgi:hypothetical protein
MCQGRDQPGTPTDGDPPQTDQGQRHRCSDATTEVQLASDVEGQHQQQESAHRGRFRARLLHEPGEGHCRQGQGRHEVAHVPMVVHQVEELQEQDHG